MHARLTLKTPSDAAPSYSNQDLLVAFCQFLSQAILTENEITLSSHLVDIDYCDEDGEVQWDTAVCSTIRSASNSAHDSYLQQTLDLWIDALPDGFRSLAIVDGGDGTIVTINASSLFTLLREHFGFHLDAFNAAVASIESSMLRFSYTHAQPNSSSRSAICL
jgi:hypothetical protein